jgi:mono/diheme cytochrome c family protein
MKMLRTTLAVLALLSAGTAYAQDAEVSVAKGERISRIGGCHDCHSVGFNESGGTIDPATALKGNPVGFQGPWGTTYAPNLRLEAAEHTEDEFVAYIAALETKPPMPWFNLHYLDESEVRSLHQYILSLGEPGDPAPAYVPPGQPPKSPFIIFAPPTMPAS